MYPLSKIAGNILLDKLIFSKLERGCCVRSKQEHILGHFVGCSKLTVNVPERHEKVQLVVFNVIFINSFHIWVKVFKN